MEHWQQKNQETIERAIAIIQHVPFIRAIILTGSMAEQKETKNSDIDFFIEVREGTIWTSRAIITLLIQWAGIRRTDTEIAGKICLNWYATYNAPVKQQGRVYKALWQGQPNKIAEGLFSLVLWLTEPLARIYQISRINKDPRTHLAGSAVRFSDQELGFHPPKGYSPNEH